VRIVYLAAGAAGMHCGACARDVTLVRGLLRLGCDVTLVPLYTPLRIDGDPPPGMTRTFLGGINVYLQHRFGLFRVTPRLVDRLLDSRPLLALASRFAIRTRARELGPMTLAVLRGEEGSTRKELHRVIEFLAAGARPDVVCLTNSLLSGFAPALQKRLSVPVVSKLQGEDAFVDEMPEPYRGQVRDQMRLNAAHISLFVAPSDEYAAKMAEYLAVPRGKVAAVRNGIDLDLYPRVERRVRQPFAVGHLSRLTPGKGLDLLVEAVRILAVEQGRDVRLRAAGKVVDRSFWRSVRSAARRAGLADRFEYVGELDLRGKVAFLHSLSAFALPSRYAELRGTAVMEAMATGLPVVVPDAGVFQDMMRLTGGGRLVPPNDPRAIAATLGQLMDQPEAADAVGLAGREGIRVHYSAAGMAEETLRLYAGLCGDRRG